jgi:hypothetical protein
VSGRERLNLIYETFLEINGEDDGKIFADFARNIVLLLALPT